MMGGGKSGSHNGRTPKYTGMQLQTSAYGVPVPVVYGTTRVGWNLIDYFNFQTHQHSSGKGGVLGGGGKGGSVTTYSASVEGLICEGPITGIRSTWISQTQKQGTPGFSIFTGAIGQTPWSQATHALGYSGFAYVGALNLDLGSSANLPGYNWEVQGILQGTAPGTYGGNGCASGGDADPSRIVPDILSNAQYGVGFPASRVGEVVSNNEARTVPGSAPFTITVNNSATFNYNVNVVDAAGNLYTCVAGTPGPLQYSFSSGGVYTFNGSQAGVAVSIRYASVRALVTYQNFALASGLWVSPAYVDQVQASAAIDDIAKATFSEVVWSSGILQLVPRGTMAVAANGYTYTPNTTPVFALTADDFLPGSGGTADDPIAIHRTRASDQINVVRIECVDRANQYAPAIAEASDQARIDRYGRRAAAQKSLHIFADLNAANISAHLQLQDEYLRNHYDFTLDERYTMLDPMDIVTLTDPQYPGLAGVAVRILELTENDDGTLSISAEEYPGSIGAVPALALNSGSGLVQNFDVTPGDAAAPAIFDVPVGLVGKLGLESWLATSSATSNPNWGGCDVYVSTDGTTYAKQGTLVGPSRMGTLTAAFPSGADPDSVNPLKVDLTNSQGALSAGTLSNANNDDTICFVDGEYVSYSGATLTAAYKYTLGGSAPAYLRRGRGGSTIASHASGSLFVRLDSSVFKLPYTPADVGRNFWAKLVSFNIYGGGYQNLASVAAYSHTIGGPPWNAVVANFSAQINGNAVALSWTDLADTGVKGYDVLYGPSTGTVANATLLTEASRQTAETTVGIPPGTWNVYIRARSLAGTYGPASVVTVTVANANAVLNDIRFGPDFLGTRTGFLLHFAGLLVPDSTQAASTLTNAQLFEKTQLFPVANPSYTPSLTVDEGFASNVRVFANMTATMLAEAAGTPNVSFALDSWSSGADPNSFAPWTVGYLSARYFRFQFGEVTAGADAYISQLEVVIDAQLLDQVVNNFPVSSSGSTVLNYAANNVGPFHSAPNIQVTPVDGVGTGAGALNITTTQATIQEFTGATLVGGTVAIRLRGA